MPTFTDFNFISDYQLDKMVVNLSGTFSVTNYEYKEILLTNPIGTSFIPTLMFSYDGGTSWYKDGAYDMYWDGSSYRVKLRCYAQATNTQIKITAFNNYNGPFTVQYRIYGVSKNV